MDKDQSPSNLVNVEQATVTRVLDADTIEVEMNGDILDVRLLLVDTPETVHPNIAPEPFGVEASLYAKRILPRGKRVQLEFDGPLCDMYGRILAYMWVDGQLFNEMLLEEGMAHIAYVFDPPYTYYEQFVSAQGRARRGRKGIWGVGYRRYE
ncbi:thermonuclease family protein [Aquibacillus kalidii]|uniref:thermonuclease family protein n=1 Tax=Aquibacillus kalidii TaxID=2762597 RepID=UPI00164819A3|nr:thermonuclease family protein [Aquibacillus kalidii]